jgi:hypothetical protein
MSWNIQKPGDFINGPLTVAGVAQFNSNVGVGVTPSAWSQGKALELGFLGNSIWGAAPNQTIITANSYYNGGWKYAANGTATNYEQASGQHFWYSAPNNTLGAGQTCTFGPAKMTLNANGVLALLNGNAAANGVGIAFGSTQSASTDANTLDDYEEGTWTPTIIGTTTAGTGTYSFQGGQYTKIGNRVFVEGYLSWSAHTGTGNMRIGGLPFAISNASFYSSGSIGDVNAIALTAENTLAILGVTSSSSIEMRQFPTGGGTSAAVPIDTQANISFSFCYLV